MTADKTEERTSVLKKLTADVMESKKAEARKLTPLPGESPFPPMSQAQIPNDVGGIFLSNELLGDHAKALRQFAADAITIADGLDAMLNESSVIADKPVDLDAARKAKEADADFNADFKAKQEAAKQATFAEAAEDHLLHPTAAEPVNPDLAEFGWVCPDHGKAKEKRSEKTGRTYVGCPDCNLFKR